MVSVQDDSLMDALSLMMKLATLPTIACLVFGAAYLATKRAITLKIACAFLLVAILLWVPVVLVGLGVLPMPAVRPR
jgi:hypothetical protein